MMGPDENSAAQGDDSMTATSLGKTLREQRERLGMSISDVSALIKLEQRQIEALETGDLQCLPEMAFVRGFVRSYARALHLDEKSLLALLPQVINEPAKLLRNSVEVPFPDQKTKRLQNLALLGAALLLSMMVGAFAVWHFTMPTAMPTAMPEVARVETPPPLSEVQDIIPASPEAQPAATPADNLTMFQLAPQSEKPVPSSDTTPQDATLRLVFDAESWTEIAGKDGQVLSSQINPRGSELELRGQEPFSLVIGHAASVRLYHRGRQVDLTPYVNSSSEVARLKLE